MEIKKVIKAYSLDEALKALKEHAGNCEVMAGGTDLSVQIREGHNSNEVLVDITDVPELLGIFISENEIRIGSAAKYGEVVASAEIKEILRGLWDASNSVGAPQIRNLGTIGGNIANGSPAADSIPPLLALDAKITIKSLEAERVVRLEDIYLGKGKVDIKKDEIIVDIIIERPTAKLNVEFEKLGLRNALAISRLSTSVYLDLDGDFIKSARVGSGSLGLYPLREATLEEFLTGKTLNDDLIKLGSLKYSEIVADRLKGRSTCEFKREAVKGVFEAAMGRILASL
ncbi:MAG: FAD binding domain-containing protein [Acidaminobacteraceae bacterium]